jgi:hypothetical protein
MTKSPGHCRGRLLEEIELFRWRFFAPLHTQELLPRDCFAVEHDGGLGLNQRFQCGQRDSCSAVSEKVGHEGVQDSALESFDISDVVWGHGASIP